jgi:hypothetical protein
MKEAKMSLTWKSSGKTSNRNIRQKHVGQHFGKQKNEKTEKDIGV